MRLTAKQVVGAIAANDMSQANLIIDKNTVDFSVEEKQSLVGMILDEALNNPDISASKTADKLNNPQEVISEEQGQKTPETNTTPQPETVANNVKAAMDKNGEILIEGQIPGEFIVPAK